MREGITIRLWPGDQERLQAVVADRKTPQHHAWRARIVSDDGRWRGNDGDPGGDRQSKPTIWRWQERYMHDGADGLFRDAPRGKTFAPLPPEQIAAVIERTLHESAPNATHWTLRGMAKASGLAPPPFTRSGASPG